MIDPFATLAQSPIAAVRIPARRDREYLAFQVLGLTKDASGVLAPGSEAEKAEARRWLQK